MQGARNIRGLDGARRFATLDDLRAFAEAVLCSPFVLATVPQLKAEAIAGFAYAQLIKPGTKTICSQFSVPVPMKIGALGLGMPDASQA
ncbi:hypothetical protein RA19_22765 [Leisingera sp. ANG-M1]|nr:trimethylamine methyltransferase family protein [Leisingera sp. ANG-M1]KIC07624.1 hypothetical protein RA19_22765 [Leisingera sp. ANG-M1]